MLPFTLLATPQLKNKLRGSRFSGISVQMQPVLELKSELRCAQDWNRMA